MEKAETMFTPRCSYEMTSVLCFNRGSISYESPFEVTEIILLVWS